VQGTHGGQTMSNRDEARRSLGALAIIDGVACPKCGAPMGDECGAPMGDECSERVDLYFRIGCDEMHADGDLDVALAESRDRATQDDEKMIADLIGLVEDMIAEHGLPYKYAGRLDEIAGWPNKRAQRQHHEPHSHNATQNRG